jgi:integrase
MSDIIRGKVRILRPSEYIKLVKNIPKREYQILFNTLLFTGMRYIECQRFKKHPEWFDGNFINLPEEAVKKMKRKQRERSVRLTPLGKQLIPFYLDLDISFPALQNWRDNLQRWATYADISPKSLSAKTTRKTWESWLVFYYPERITEITLSQGHDTVTAIRHYLNMPFTDDDKRMMKDYLEGWI